MRFLRNTNFGSCRGLKQIAQNQSCYGRYNACITVTVVSMYVKLGDFFVLDPSRTKAISVSSKRKWVWTDKNNKEQCVLLSVETYLGLTNLSTLPSQEPRINSRITFLVDSKLVFREVQHIFSIGWKSQWNSTMNAGFVSLGTSWQDLIDAYISMISKNYIQWKVQKAKATTISLYIYN